MRRLWPLIAIVILITSVLLGPSAAAATCDGALHPVEHPATLDTELRGVTILERNDAWAVGLRRESPGTAGPLAEHWDGADWNIILVDNPAVNRHVGRPKTGRQTEDSKNAENLKLHNP